MAQHDEGDAGSMPRIARLLIRRDRFDQEVERRCLDTTDQPVAVLRGCAVDSLERDPLSDEGKAVCADVLSPQPSRSAGHALASYIGTGT